MRLLIQLNFLLLSLTSFGSGWVQKSDFGGTARHRSIGLSLANKSYMGLGHYNGGGTNILFKDWWEYDPATNSWTQKADYLGGNCYHATGFTINNIAYVGTGRISVSGNTLVQDFFKYEPSSNSWSTISQFPGSARRGAISFMINDIGYVGTGETNFGRTNSFYKYNPVTDTWSPTASMPTTGRTSSVGFSIENFGYVGTGNTNFGSVNDFWQYNPVTDSWLQKANVGPTNRQEAAGFALNGKGYIGTGDDFSSGNNFKDFWQYDPITNSWIQIENFQGTARRYLTAFTHGNFAYAGLGTNGTNFKDFWQFDQYLSLIEQNINQVELSIYPNPSRGIINLKINWFEPEIKNGVKLKIHSILGETKLITNVDNGLNKMNLTNYESGVYYYTLEYSNVIINSGQIIIE